MPALPAICCTLFLFPPLIKDCFVFSLLVLRLFLHLDLFDVFFLGGCFLPPSTISKHHLFALLGGPFPVKPLLFPAHQVFFLILLFFFFFFCSLLGCFLPSCSLNAPCIFAFRVCRNGPIYSNLDSGLHFWKLPWMFWIILYLQRLLADGVSVEGWGSQP